MGDPQADMTGRLPNRARQIIAANHYMTLATSDHARPWAAPVAYVHADGTFYWASRRDAQHSRDIELTGVAAIAVFDSTARYAEVDGLQANGKASAVADDDLDRVFGLYVARYPMYADVARAQLAGSGPLGLYRFSPTALYLVDLDASEGDQRITVNLPLG